MKIIDYLVVEGASVNQLEREVKMHLAQGWQPYGCPRQTENRNYLQAMVKYEERKKGVVVDTQSGRVMS